MVSRDYQLRSLASPNGYTGLDRLEATLPKRWYIDPSQYARELKHIWYRNWLYVCRADALPEPGSFKTYEIGDQNVLLVKDRHGEIRAFHNTCRHRGSRIVNQPEGKLGALALTCPYHAWVYKLDGRLFKTPNLMDDGGLDKSLYGLFPVALKNWRGFLFLCLAEDPPALRRHVQRCREPLRQLAAGRSRGRPSRHPQPRLQLEAFLG